MKKNITLFAVILLVAGATAWKVSYSAVVRNSDNELVTNANVTVRIAISPESNGNPVVYMETHQTVTNQNGQVRLTVGNGTQKSGSLSDVNWSSSYILSEFVLPDGSHVSSIMPVEAVPYALYVEHLNPEGLLSAVESMTPDQIADLRDSLGIPQPDPDPSSCGTMTDADGNHYQRVKVGSQCWAKTNLRTTKYRKGSPISTQIGTTIPAYYRLSNTDKTTDSIVKLVTAPDSIFGFYYNGYAAVRDSLCPVGWHVPDTNDWKDFIGYLKARPEYWCDNDPSNLAKAVASRNFWYSVETPPITYTIHHDPVARPCSPQYQFPDYLNDASYFSAIPAGAWYDNLGGNIDTVTGLGGHEFDPGKDAHFWSSSTQLGSDSKGYLIRFGLVTYDAVTFVYDALKYGRSVRCLRDALSVTTTGATDITSSSVTLSGTITNPRHVQQTISAQGFEWKASGASAYTSVSASGTTMSYSLTGLSPDTEYVYRAFVTTEEGTFYGREVKFRTLVP